MSLQKIKRIEHLFCKTNDLTMTSKVKTFYHHYNHHHYYYSSLFTGLIHSDGRIVSRRERVVNTYTEQAFN